MLDAEQSESELRAHEHYADRLARSEERARQDATDKRPEEKPAAPKEEDKPAEAKDESKPKDEAKDEKAKAQPPFWRRRPLTTVAILAAVLVVGAASYVWYDNASHFESTDDAFVASRPIAIAPKITGYVAAVPVTDNQHVAANDVIAKLDDRDYQVALDQANAQISAAKAGIANAEAQRDVQAAQIEASRAQVDQARAALDFAKQQASRYEDLAKKGSGSVQNAQQYNSQLGQQEAAVKSAEAAEIVSERQLEQLKAQLLNAQAQLSVNEAQRDQAVLNLTYATVRAVEPGRIVSLSAFPGELAQAGTNLTMFVPDAIWIVANYKETQLDRMRDGQPVDVSIDAYPNRVWKGHIESVQPGSGTAFSLLPAQNATGNYVKVVQRVPVKIVLDEKPDDVALGPGMSVVPYVRVDPTPSLYERYAPRLAFWKKP